MRPLDEKAARAVLALITPFRGREVEVHAPVRVYRNLHGRGGRWSIQQRVGRSWLVVGHADRLMLGDVTFHVSAACVRRMKRVGHKVVCAWACGHLTESGMGVAAADGPRLPERVIFESKRAAFLGHAARPPRPMAGAWVIALNEHGLTSAYGYSR